MIVETVHQDKNNSDYHGHPNYIKVWAVLVVLLVVSLLFGYLGNKRLEVAGIFTLAVVKAVLVLGHFMHLKWEPKATWLIVGFGVLCLLFFYFGVLPDIVYVPLTIVE